MSRNRYDASVATSSRSRRLAEEFVEDLKAHDYQPRGSNTYSQSPMRGGVSSASTADLYLEDYYCKDNNFFEFYDPDASLRHKWMDNSPRMSRLREHRQKRLINRLEVSDFL